MDPYLTALAETALRKVLSSDESITAKSEYLARLLEAAVRNQVSVEVDQAFGRILQSLELELLATEEASEVYSIQETQESLSSIRDKVLGWIR